LLALARSEPIHDRFTLRVLRRAGLIRRDGVATGTGRAQAAKALRDEKRWEIARRLHETDALGGRYDGLAEIETVFTPDEIAELDRVIGPPMEVPA
ncbi:MAG: metal ABC transporter permease, partial [Rhodobacteraceae bacterium]|nr:metal ABC transporter permease [Paracoccaceae bacterium]